MKGESVIDRLYKAGDELLEHLLNGSPDSPEYIKGKLNGICLAISFARSPLGADVDAIKRELMNRRAAGPGHVSPGQVPMMTLPDGRRVVPDESARWEQESMEAHARGESTHPSIASEPAPAAKTKLELSREFTDFERKAIRDFSNRGISPGLIARQFNCKDLDVFLLGRSELSEELA